MPYRPVPVVGSRPLPALPPAPLLPPPVAAPEGPALAPLLKLPAVPGVPALALPALAPPEPAAGGEPAMTAVEPLTPPPPRLPGLSTASEEQPSARASATVTAGATSFMVVSE